MNRKLLLTGVIALGMIAGCNNNKKEEEMAAKQKYKILSGSTAEQRAMSKEDDAFNRAREPELLADTRFAAGQLNESQGRYDCAIVQYEQALRLDNKHVPSLYRMGIVYTKLKSFDKAVDMWKRYIAATGNHPSGYSNLGFCFEMARDVANAEAAYEKGLSIDPNNRSCRVNYGLMLARNNRTGEAQQQLAMVLSPAEVSFNLAQIYEQQGAIARAKDEYRKALEANPTMTEAQTKLATLPQD